MKKGCPSVVTRVHDNVQYILIPTNREFLEYQVGAHHDSAVFRGLVKVEVDK